MPGASLFRMEDGRLRPGLRAILFLALTLVLYYLTVGAFAVWPGALPGRSALVWVGIWRGVQLVILLIVSRFMVVWFDRRSFRTLGLWNYPGFARELAMGAALGSATVTAGAILLLASGRLVIVTWTDNWKETTVAAATGFLLVAIAASWEEILFRGYPFQRLIESLSPVASVAIFSTFFGLMHKSNPDATPLSVANTVIAGTFFAVAYLKTRGLWLPLGFHIAWNYVQGCLFSLPVSGIRMYRPAAILEWRLPVWLSGGGYGLEGSVVTTLLLAALTLWLVRTRRVSPSAAMREVLK